MSVLAGLNAYWLYKKFTSRKYSTQIFEFIHSFNSVVIVIPLFLLHLHLVSIENNTYDIHLMLSEDHHQT